MRCPKCDFSAESLDIYGIIDLSEDHPERIRWQNNPEHRKTLEFYAWFICGKPDVRILDLGAGPGTVAVPLARLDNVAEVVCMENDPEAITSLKATIDKEGIGNINIASQGEPWDLPFDDGSFDVVVARYSLHHFSNPNKTLAESFRCLKPGGMLLYSDPVLPPHSRNSTHGLFLVREGSFSGYLTIHEMINIILAPGFHIASVRNYLYQRGTLTDYLAKTDTALKAPLTRAWLNLDQHTKDELHWAGQQEGPFITYTMADFAAEKPLLRR
jgi:SAM-dependent methyltransferase